MHLPNEYVNNATCIATAATSATAIAWAITAVNKGDSQHKSNIAALAVATSAIFVAQMFNFPIMEGVSGHLIGGALLGAFFGPARAILAMVCITFFQALLLGDGGLAALGANSLNLAIIPAFLGAFGSRLSNRIEIKALAVAAAATVATVLSSISAGIMIAASSSVLLSESLQAMVSTHWVAGLYEGGLTLLAYSAAQLLLSRKRIPAKALINER